MEIKINDSEILWSGSVIVFDNNPVDLIIDVRLGFLVRFEFIDDINTNKLSVKPEPFVDGVKFIFNNFNYCQGIGNHAPIPIGELNGKKLFLSYLIYAYKRQTKHIHYTLMFKI
ncbi:MAG: hypothetical protein RL641_435 [Candidatus Parcubacteria bacterium]|jgi:hypothetical protein